jgi:hypothetical protein
MDEQRQRDPSDDDYPEAQRSIIRQSFDEIVNLVGIRMRDALLTFPLGLTIPSSGAFIPMLTPGDPSDEEWEKASAIVCNIVADKLGGIRLQRKRLPCAMVNATMAATDILPNVLSFDTRL